MTKRRTCWKKTKCNFYTDPPSHRCSVKRAAQIAQSNQLLCKTIFGPNKPKQPWNPGVRRSLLDGVILPPYLEVTLDTGPLARFFTFVLYKHIFSDRSKLSQWSLSCILPFLWTNQKLNQLLKNILCDSLPHTLIQCSRCRVINTRHIYITSICFGSDGLNSMGSYCQHSYLGSVLE